MQIEQCLVGFLIPRPLAAAISRRDEFLWVYPNISRIFCFRDNFA